MWYQHRYNLAKFTCRRPMCQMYKSRYADTSYDVCGGLLSAAMGANKNSDDFAVRSPPYSKFMARLPEFFTLTETDT